MSENRALRRIFVTRKEEMVGGWRRLHNEELHNLYVSPNIIRVIKSRSMRRARHIARMEHKKYIDFGRKALRGVTTRKT
jgi:hypothetical protein